MHANGQIARGRTMTPVPDSRHAQELRRYFEHGKASETIEAGLKEMAFGEYLVEQGVLDRFQLLRSLQMQDRLPGVRLGEAAAALGYAPINAIERLFERYTKMPTAHL